jgi:PEP-CTERM motif
MQRLTLKLGLLLLLLLTLTAVPAFADLANANVTVNYLYPEINDVYEVLGTGTVTDSGFTVNSFGQHDFTVFPDEITLTNVSGGNVNFTAADFNGYGVVVNFGGSPITGVTLEFTDISGFDISRVTWDSNDVWVNLQGLTTTPGLDLQLGLEFGGGGGTTPEPSSILLMGSGLAAVVGFSRRKFFR